MTDIRGQVREQERDILTMNDEDLISEVRKGHMAVAGFVRSHGSEASKHECLRAFEAFDELADRLRRYRPMPLTDVPVAPAGQAGIEELREALALARGYIKGELIESAVVMPEDGGTADHKTSLGMALDAALAASSPNRTEGGK